MCSMDRHQSSEMPACRARGVLEAAPILQPFGSALSGSEGSLALASAIALASSGTYTSNMSYVVKSKTLGHVGEPGNI